MTVQNIHSNFQTQMSFQITNNNYTTAPTSPNPYIPKKLNNMDKAKIIKAERNDWMRLYYKTLKGLEVIIDVQKQIKDMLKITAETNITTTEMKDSILKASIKNRVTNAINITEISEDLQYLIQSNIKD